MSRDNRPGCVPGPWTDDDCKRLWARVIDSALNDATLGVSWRKVNGLPVKASSICKRPHSSGICEHDVRSGLAFIKGEGGYLRFICDLCGWDYDSIKEGCKRRYEVCRPYIPEQYRGEI